jgi:hypothetical protein
MHENGHCGADDGPTKAVFDGVNYFGKDVVPLYMFESSEAPFACASTGQGRPAAFMFLHQASTLRRSCISKIQKHKGAKVIRCVSSNGGHFGDKCPCCKSVYDWWTEHHPDDPVVLLSPPARFAVDAGVKERAWLEDQGACGADVGDAVWNENRWWKRDSTVARAVTDYCDDSEVPNHISLYPLVSGYEPLAQMDEQDDQSVQQFEESHEWLDVDSAVNPGWEDQVDYTATVYGAKFSQKVIVYKAVGKPIDGAQCRKERRFQGMAVGLFRYAPNAFLDCVMLYDYIEQSHNGKVSIQSFWQRKKKEYAATARCNQEQHAHCEDFPSLQKFTEAIHLFVTQLVRWFLRVHLCFFLFLTLIVCCRHPTFLSICLSMTIVQLAEGRPGN